MSVVHLSIALQLMLPSVNTSNQVIKSTGEFSWMEITNAVPTRPCPVFTLSRTPKPPKRDSHKTKFSFESCGKLTRTYAVFFTLHISESIN